MFNIDEVYTVSDFLFFCNKTIEDNIPTCWLRGEVSNFSTPSSGHWYFSLKDNKGQVRCVLFRLNRRKVKFIPENGVEVLVRAAPTLYESRGNFQIVIKSIEPVGVGNLQLAFEQLKNKLAKEGLFDIARKKPLPLRPKIIGVISSKTGAVIKDIIKVLNKRYPFSKILLFDSIVQGENAADKLAQTVIIADKSNKCDVLIIARGGGSLEDLWAFNEEVLARAIFNAKTPIISAVGHETDTTIVDFIADKRAPTPSAAAMIITPDRLEILTNINKLYAKLNLLSLQLIKNKQNKLENLKLMLPAPDRQINFFSQKLDNLSSQIRYQAKALVNLGNAQLETLSEKLKQHSPSYNIKHKKQLNTLAKIQLIKQIKHIVNLKNNRLNSINERLTSLIAFKLKTQQSQLSLHANALNHLSPLNTLSRGFSITTDKNNNILSSSKNIKINDTITTKLINGKIYSKVNKIENS